MAWAALLRAQHVAAIARIDRVTAVQQNASLDKTSVLVQFSKNHSVFHELIYPLIKKIKMLILELFIFFACKVFTLTFVHE